MAKGTCFDNLYRRDDIHLAAFTLYIYIYIYIFFFFYLATPGACWGSPGDSEGKDFACSSGDPGLIPGSSLQHAEIIPRLGI